MRVQICGVRGSTPAPGPDFVRYGGDTSCIALSSGAGEPAQLVLDAGTGLRRLTPLLGAEPFAGSILLTHLHWDHVQGIPFFGGADRPDARTEVFVPDQQDGIGAEATLAKGMSPPQFPIRPRELRGNWTFTTIAPGMLTTHEFTVEVREVPHKGGRTFGYRVSTAGSALAYIPDHCPTDLGAGPDGWGEYHEAALELARDTDLLIHDSHLRADELARDAYLSHSVPEYAVGLARRAGARAVVLFHHRPERTDDELDALARTWAGAEIPVTVAAEGANIDL